MTLPLSARPLALCTALVASILSGCAVGPDYKLPEAAQFNNTAAQGTFVGAKNNPTFDETQIADRWWHLYQSDVLDRLVTEGFAANTDLRVAEANLTRSQSLVRLAKSQGQPQLSFGGGFERALLSAESYLSPAENLPADNLYDIELSASYEVDLFGRIQRGVEASQADSQSVAAARDWVRVTVAAKITRFYVQVCSDGDELAVAHRSVDLQQQSLDLTRRLQENGRATRLDVTRSQALVNQLRAAIPVIEARRQNALYQLAVLTGKPPSQFDESLTSCVEVPPIASPIPVGNGASLLKRRPDVRAAERQLAAATARIGVATADLYPRIVLRASIGSTGVTSDFLEHSTNEWSVGPFVQWQLNQNPTRARIAAANAAQQAQLARFDGTVLGALRDVESAMNNYSHDLQQESTLTSARDDAARAAQDAHELQSEGRSGDLATLDAERTLASSESALAASRSRTSLDQVNLFMALGGGWESAD
ncbi:efflux transporter outer membrane subunit [Paraburkholderia sp. C35]|uniref:efflux transporter outer membrane subunit n=1 Tax=Paraburkholderia sp. C35 TaxID=2126993 RepID=UPI000D698CF9|nr:efflux transporter outer membrane subunit [Paraburkholderia sp. C35]